MTAAGRSTTLSEAAYQRILRGLFDRTIPAGSFLSQAEISQMLDIPIQPLRDALRTLDADGLVTIHPRSGIQFLKPDLDFVHNTYQFRSIIERAAARRLAEVGDEALITSLRDDHDAMIAAVEAVDDIMKLRDRMRDLERRMHGAMIASLKNPLIERAALRLNNYLGLILLDRPTTKPFVLLTLREHLEILRHCAARDADGAEQALIRHFQLALSRMTGSI